MIRTIVVSMPRAHPAGLERAPVDTLSMHALEHPSLAAGSVHVWHIPLDAPELVMRSLRALLSPDERRRAEAVRLVQHRRYSVVSHGAARMILSSYLGVSPREIRFVLGHRGKPGLPAESNPGDLQFNLAHSGSLALLAVSRGRAVGIDVERMRRAWRYEDVVRRFFSADEAAEMASLPRSLRREAFYTVWTRKEAYLKGLGLGVGDPMRQFVVSADPRSTAMLIRTEPYGGSVSRWELLDLPVPRGYRGCLAVEEPVRRIELVRLWSGLWSQ